MSKSVLGLILMWLISLPLRAEQPIFNISSLDANPGDIINVDFHVNDFSDIVSVQFSVNWNEAVLEYRTVKNFNTSIPGLTISSIGTTEVAQGKLRVQWFEASINPITIPDGSLFFTLEFEVVGTPCQSSPVAITGDPLEIEVGEGVAGVDVGLVTNNGLVNVPGTGCAQNIQFNGNNVIGPCGGQACIQFTVDNFITVGAMEFSMTYNPSVLSFNEFRNFAPLPGFGAGNTNLVSPGLLRVLWFNSNVVNDTLPDGTVLFEICFDVIGLGGQSSQITFGNDPSVMISDINGNFHEVAITPAVITAQCALEGFALIADTVCTQPNGVVCMDIKVNDFDDLIAFQYSMNWDSTKFQFDHIEGFGLTGLTIENFGTPGFPGVKKGQLTVSWIDLSLQGVTLPDYATIYRLCLKAIGAVNTASPVTFTANPLEIEFLNAQDSVLEYALLQGRAEIKQSCTPGCQVSFVLNTLQPACPGDCNGVLNLNVTTTDCQGTPSYLWSSGETTEDITGKCAGIYCVTITVDQTSVIVCDTIISPQPFAVSSNITHPTFPPGNNGAIDITVSGGTPPYTFQWSTPPGSTTEDINNLSPGTYTVTIRDKNFCQFVPDPFVVGQSSITASITDVKCFGGSDGAINISPAFGTAPHTYQWSTPPGSVTEDISNLHAGTYCVTVTDSGGTSRDSCFTVNQPLAITASASITHDVNENCQGAIDLSVLGGTQPYSYLWSNGEDSQDILALCPGQYCVTITDANGCILDTCFTVFGEGLNLILEAEQYGNFQTSCDGRCDGEITSTVIGGSGTLTYAWSNNQSSANLFNVCEGSYTLTVTDGSGNSATATIVINAPPPLTVVITVTEPTDLASFDGALSAVVNGGTPGYTHQWTGPVNGNGAALNNIPGGSYLYQVSDANGCELDTVISLLPGGVPCFDGIRVITPNEDDRNDFFIITCVLDAPNHLYIFNRQGGLVYETSNYKNNWDGVDEDDNEVPDGGYLWVLEVNGPLGAQKIYKGAVNVLRTAD